MARIATRQAVIVAGIREHLYELLSTLGDQQRVGALLAGESVRVPGWMLPAVVRQAAEYQRATRRGGIDDGIAPRAVTAVVYPDGRVAYEPETAADWFTEQMPGDSRRALSTYE